MKNYCHVPCQLRLSTVVREKSVTIIFGKKYTLKMNNKKKETNIAYGIRAHKT